MARHVRKGHLRLFRPMCELEGDERGQAAEVFEAALVDGRADRQAQARQLDEARMARERRFIDCRVFESHDEVAKAAQVPNCAHAALHGKMQRVRSRRLCM